jgi:hypothetical protein
MGGLKGRLSLVDLNKSKVSPETCLVAKSSMGWLWHRWLAHVGMRNLVKLLKDEHILWLTKVHFEMDRICKACQAGKQVGAPHPPNLTKLRTCDVFPKSSRLLPDSLPKTSKSQKFREIPGGSEISKRVVGDLDLGVFISPSSPTITSFPPCTETVTFAPHSLKDRLSPTWIQNPTLAFKFGVIPWEKEQIQSLSCVLEHLVKP